MLSSRHSFTFIQAEGGGRLWDLGAHAVDHALCLFHGRTPVQVYAQIKYKVPEAPGMDSQCNILIDFDDDSTATIDVGSLIALEKPRFLLIGDQATFTKSGFDPQEGCLVKTVPASFAIEPAAEYGQIYYRRFDKSLPQRVVTEATAAGRWATYYDDVAAYIREDGHLGSSMAKPLPVSMEDVKASVGVLEAAIISANKKAIVKLSDLAQ